MRTVQRIAVLCVYVAAFAALFYFGREHQIFVDNRTMEADGESFRALELVRVTIDGGEPIELMPRNRDLVKVVGPSFSLKVEVMDQFGEKAEKVVEREVRLDFTKNVLLSLPLLAADRDSYILPPPEIVVPPQSERPVVNDEGFVPFGEGGE